MPRPRRPLPSATRRPPAPPRRLPGLLLALALIPALPLEVQAQDPFPYQASLASDLGLTAAAAALWALEPEFRTLDLEAETRRLTRDSVWVPDRWAVGFDSEAARRYSDMGLAALTAAPLVLLATQAEWSGDFAVLSLMTAEAAALTWLVTNRTKAWVQRRRPYLYNDRLSPEARVRRAEEDGEPLQSFFSGHTSVAFASAMYTTTVWADLEGWDGTAQALAWTSFGLATTTGIARVLGGQHHPTDVLVGAAVGMAVGWLVPRMHRLDANPGDPEFSRPSPVLSFRVPLG